MKVKAMGAIVVALATLGGTNVFADPISVSEKIPFAKGATVREAVRKECQLETKLPTFIKQFAAKEGVDVKLVAKLDKGKSLLVEITHVHASAGGAYSGPKSVSVEGKLMKNGKVISKFSASRHSGGGFFGGFKGTCDIAGRCVKTLGSDIVKWLKNPVDGAHLGDV